MIAHLEYLPIAIVVCSVGCVGITTYLSIYYYNHVTYFLPYISDTGTFPPESCIFGFILNLVGLMLLLVIYVKYLQVEEICNKHHINKKYNFNKISLFMGIVAVIGMSLVGNFQETNEFTVHWIGAILTFGVGSLYLCIQTYLYIKISPVLGQRKTTMFRIILSFISVLTFIISVCTAFIAYGQFKGDMTKWQKDQGGYNMHQISTNMEWVCASALFLYILLFYKEFGSLSLQLPKVTLEEHIQIPQMNNNI